MVAAAAPPVLIFHSCANFSSFCACFFYVFLPFVQFLAVLTDFERFMHIFCVFFRLEVVRLLFCKFFPSLC